MQHKITVIGTGYVGLVTGTYFPKDTLAVTRYLIRIKKLLRKPCFFDLRNIDKPDMITSLGFEYFSVSR